MEVWARHREHELAICPQQPAHLGHLGLAPLARGLEVLRCFTPLEPMLGNKEISVRTGLPKPTVSRLTYTLTKLGYLRHNMRLGKYQLKDAAPKLTASPGLTPSRPVSSRASSGTMGGKST